MSARSYWGCQAFGWGVYAAITSWQFTHLGDASMRGSRALVEPLFAAAVGIFLTHQLRRRMRARHWLRLPPLQLAVRVVGAPFVLALLHVAALVAVELGVYADRPPSFILMVVFAVLRWAVMFFVWVAIYLGVSMLRARQRSEIDQLKLEKALQAAELRALKSQLNPHFLFNSLNNVRALIAEDPGRAQKAVTQLARALRYTLGAADGETAAFEREMEMVNDYLDLELLRLASRLEVIKDIEESAHGARVPVMFLQLLVENAIKHGIAPLPAGGTLRICAKRLNGALLVEVSNPRPAMPTPSTHAGAGVGLANAAERLRLLFGEEATLHLDLSVPERATAQARIPQQP